MDKVNIKIPKTKSPIIDLIKNRWSARSFSEKKISMEEIMTLIEAGSWAFSASNEQPWRVIIAIKGTSIFDVILECLSSGNKPWAKNSSAFIVSIAKTISDKENNPTNLWAEHDLGAFNATMIIQATAIGISAHPMGGFDLKKLKEALKLEDYLKPMAVISLGYLDDPEKLPEPYKTRELTARSRKPLSEIILIKDDL